MEGEGKAARKRDGKIIIISEWTVLGFGEALRKAEDREEWKKSGCPIILDAPTIIQTTG